MRQMESISDPLGEGAMVLQECSSNEALPVPRLKLMAPAQFGVVINGGYADQAVANIPANSMEFYGPSVKQLYEFLKNYYEPQGANP